LDLTLVAPSAWMADRARESALFRDERIEVIANGVDMRLFRPADRRRARAGLGLAEDKKLASFAVAAGSRVPHKGLDLLESALSHLNDCGPYRERLELVMAGPLATTRSISTRVAARSLGALPDEKMAALHAAVDVTVVPSRQETLPQVAVESLACGTPVVAFDTTGISDVVDHERNGYLARPFDTEDLAYGIRWVLEDSERHRRLCDEARSKALRSFDLAVQSARYHALFRELLSRRRASAAR
jgi:glycosyltransferase involved in cell wall biosynthesis